jgi:hypothetical protein
LGVGVTQEQQVDRRLSGRALLHTDDGSVVHQRRIQCRENLRRILGVGLSSQVPLEQGGFFAIGDGKAHHGDAIECVRPREGRHEAAVDEHEARP